ncbi:hypothetical protein WMW72_35275 [Paenibacillus filicis]|uniref:Uncharacterized protein n=1 Tax=Paenibacillus filicis TaxID=669464 RepID=A0ABU9DWQ1_9BACL
MKLNLNQIKQAYRKIEREQGIKPVTGQYTAHRVTGEVYGACPLAAVAYASGMDILEIAFCGMRNQAAIFSACGGLSMDEATNFRRGFNGLLPYKEDRDDPGLQAYYLLGVETAKSFLLTVRH